MLLLKVAAAAGFHSYHHITYFILHLSAKAFETNTRNVSLLFTLIWNESFHECFYQDKMFLFLHHWCGVFIATATSDCEEVTSQAPEGIMFLKRWLHILCTCVFVCVWASSLTLNVTPSPLWEMQAHINPEPEILGAAKPIRRLLNANLLLQIFNKRPALAN